MKDLVVVGAGGFGREVLDIVDAINGHTTAPVWNIVGVVDDAPTDLNVSLLSSRGIDFLGSIEGFLLEGPQTHYIVGIGAPNVRRAVAEKFDLASMPPATLIHPTATIGYGVKIGAGSVICAGVRMTTNIQTGRHVHLNLNVTVGHDTEIGDFVSANPLASISGDCIVEDGVLIGVAGVILNGLTLGQGSTVGGSACVVKPVPRGAVVKGVPAK